ncbi:MAG: hypothetical protein NTW45_02205 [Rhodocyclales bacterium]|nr:hypothetical protein [Rhodocyclales bacterium]
MKYIIAAITLVLSSSAALAQSVAPLTAGVVLVTEVTRNVSLGSNDKNTWSDFTPREVKWSRTVQGVEVLAGSTAGVLIDTRTYLHYQVAAGVSELSETIEQSSTREGQTLEPGSSWKADRIYANPSASWCHDNRSKYDSKFEVGPREPYTLIIDGKETKLEVTPVVERGWWTKCYSGKRYTRFLVSKDLGAVVSIEHIGYNPQGQAHESSYRLNVKEIKKL